MGKRPAGTSVAVACEFCREHVARGKRVRTLAGSWAHKACAAEARRRDAILRGDTYRGHAKSTWRR